MLPPRAAPRPIGGGAWIPGPQALQPPQPRDISASNRAPGLALRSRERESLEAPGGSSRSRVVLALGLEVHTHQTAILEDCGAHRVFTTASFSHYLLLPILQLPRFPSSLHHHSPEHSPMCGQNWDFERICEPSLFLQLDFGQSGRSDLSQKMRNVNGSAVTRAFPWRKYWLLTLKLLDPTSI